MASIQERRDKNGKLISYSIRVFRGRDAQGKQLKPWTMTYEVSPNQKEDAAYKKALAAAAQFERDCKEGRTSNSRRMFSEYAGYVIELKEQRGTKHSTINWYREQLSRIDSDVACKKLKDIKADDLNDLYTRLQKTTTKATTAKAIINLPVVLKEKHITRAAIAKETGLSENTVRIAVRGDNCSVKTASAICNALGLKLEKAFFILNESKCLSGTTVTGVHRFISIVLKQAKKEGLIAVNPAELADIPKPEKKEVQSLQTSDLPAILKALESEPLKWKTITHLLLMTGCRRGEIAGLSWENVDFTNNRLKIKNNLQYCPDVGLYMETPKTDDSFRWVAVPKQTMKLLEEWKAYQEADAREKGAFFQNKEGLLFTQENGSPMHPDSITSWLSKFAKKHGLTHLFPHKFRHTMASMLIHEHVDIVSVSKRLGHSQVSTTTDIYSHVIAEADKENADLLGSIFLKKA